MNENLIEVRDYDGEGYQPLIDFGEWRVAILRHLDELEPNHISSMERHSETDEVFILVQGSGILFLGGNRSNVDGVISQTMEVGKIYNIKRNVWHTVALSRDAKIVLMENRDTGQHNSEYVVLAAEHIQAIRYIANHILAR